MRPHSRIYDITVPLSPSLAAYPGDPPIEIVPVTQLAEGDVANVSRVTLSSHSGTHLDASRHFFAQGDTIDALDLTVLIGPVRVCAMTGRTHITADDLRRLDLDTTQRVLFKTDNGGLRFRVSPVDGPRGRCGRQPTGRAPLGGGRRA